MGGGGGESGGGGSLFFSFFGGFLWDCRGVEGEKAVFSGVSGGFRVFLPTCFYGKVVGKRRRGKEEKLKSAIRKILICDHIVFLKVLFGAFFMPRIAVKMPILAKKPPQMLKNAPNRAPNYISGTIWGEICRYFLMA